MRKFEYLKSKNQILRYIIYRNQQCANFLISETLWDFTILTMSQCFKMVQKVGCDKKGKLKFDFLIIDSKLHFARFEYSSDKMSKNYS